MPGIVVFNRRWAVGSDDFVVPGIFLCILHAVWLLVLSIVLATFTFNREVACVNALFEHLIGYVVLLGGCVCVEAAIAWVSLRGTILETEPRASMQYLLYIRLGILFVEIGWLVVGMVWLVNNYNTCPAGSAKNVTVGVVICNWCVVVSVVITLWCTFDAAGRSWVKMKNYQRSLRDSKTRFNYKRSGSMHRDWRHRRSGFPRLSPMERGLLNKMDYWFSAILVAELFSGKVMRAYQESWNTRCRLLFCCAGQNDSHHRNSFTEIAKLLSEFFRDLDVVPSDVIAGLVLLRHLQKLEKEAIVAQKENDTYEFLSGIPITPASRFLALHNPEILEEFKNVIHYMRYALAVYGWPMYIKGHAGTGVCRLCPFLRCCCCWSHCRKKPHPEAMVVEDNCCQCNHAAMCKMMDLESSGIVYVTYHVEVGETPFFVAVDHNKRKVVVSIRGTLSLQDVITDLNAEGEQLPIDPPRDEWIGHKGMVHAAEYIRKKLREEMVLSKAFGYDIERGTQTYDIVLVGHSLGAGTAAILAILLKQEFPNLQCYAYSPPGGLLSMPAVEYTKSFITSVVIGKDVVPRIGLHQMESLRSDLINAIKGSQDPKWKVIAGSVFCCQSQATEVDPMAYDLPDKEICREVASRPGDGNIALTVHQPLYPPGRIIHVVRHHPTKAEQMINKAEPVYQALWAENTDFDQVLISPVMIQDHMPDKVLEALQKVLSNVGPPKPQRIFTDADRTQLLPDSPESPQDRTPPHRLCLETSFTDLNPESLNGLSIHSSCHGELPDAPPPPSATHSWEYNVALEDHLASQLHRQRTLSAPRTLMGPRYSNGGDYYQQVPLRDDWMGLAPLATPETLSDVSSVSSRGSSGRFTAGCLRLSALGVAGGSGRPFSTSSAVSDDYVGRQSTSNGDAVNGVALVDDMDFYNESSQLLLDAPPQTECTGISSRVLVTSAVVEAVPRTQLDSTTPTILELDSDGEGPSYNGARLSFDLSQDTSTSKTSEDTGYHGDQEVFMMCCNSPKDAPTSSTQLSVAGHAGGGGGGRDANQQTQHQQQQLPPLYGYEDEDEQEDAIHRMWESCKRQPPGVRAAPPSRQDSCPSGTDTISDVYDHSFSSNPSPLVSPASTEIPPAATANLLQLQASELSLDSKNRQPTHAWVGPEPPLSPLRRLQAPYGSPRKWGCSRQARSCTPREIIPHQAKLECDEVPPRMCFHHDVSPDESSV